MPHAAVKPRVTLWRINKNYHILSYYLDSDACVENKAAGINASALNLLKDQSVLYC